MSIFLFGLVGNFLGTFMLAKRKILERLGPKHMYIYLFSTDTLFLVQLIFTYISSGWPEYDPTLMSVYVCKIYMLISFASDTFSPYLIVYISVERFLSQRITENLSIQNRNKRLKRVIKISTSLIFINIFYIILVSPVSVASVHLYQASIMSLLFTCAYGNNFYLIFFTNSLVSNELF